MACRGLDPAKNPAGHSIATSGSGMGAALNAAQAMNAYTISDRGTRLSFANKGALTVLWDDRASATLERRPRTIRMPVCARNPARTVPGPAGHKDFPGEMLAASVA